MPKHFDIVYTNPPYSNTNTDLTLINDLLINNLADQIVAVHPTTFIWSKKRISDVMINSLKSVNIFWGNNLFDIQLFVPLCISDWSTNNKNKQIHINDSAYSKLEYDCQFDKITIHGLQKYFKFKESIQNYIKEHNGSVFDYRVEAGYKNMTKYSVKFSYMRGSLNKDLTIADNFFTMINKEQTNNECDDTFRFSDNINQFASERMALWSFGYEWERQNFIIYCKTKIARFLLTFTKCNSSLFSGETKILPWLDFGKTWNDQQLIKEFNIDQELWDYIDKFIPNYYDDYSINMIPSISKPKNYKPFQRKKPKSLLIPKHFDIVYTNPPYSCDISLLNDLIENDLTDDIIAVHPTTYIFSKDILSNKEKMKSWLESINIFWGNDLFNIKIFLPVCISNWSKDNTSQTIHVVDNGYSHQEYDEEYQNIYYYGSKNKETLQFRDRIIQYMKDHKGSILDNNIKAGYNGMTQYSVKFNAVCGRVPYKEQKVHDSFWTMICKDESFNRCDETFRYSPDVYKTYSNQMCLWSFNNQKERTNFINYCKTKVARFILTFTKKNVNLISGKVTSIIPWLDFSKQWTDKDLCKEFGISDELWNYIDKFIPKFYIDQ